MDELKKMLKYNATLNTVDLIFGGVTEQDVDDLCKEYHLTRKTEQKGSYYIIQFYQKGKVIKDFSSLLSM